MTLIKSAMYALQVAIYARLSARLTLAPIYDAVPDNAKFPYCTIGEDEETYTPTKGYQITENLHTVHVWSRYDGMSELARIIDEILQAFDEDIDMSAFGFEELMLVPEQSQLFRDEAPDGTIVRHGVVQLRATIQQT